MHGFRWYSKYKEGENKWRSMVDNHYENAYGLVLFEESGGEIFPVMCGHGGSMFLCYDCAEAAVKGLPAPKKPCPFHKGPGPFTFSCSWPECPLSSYEIERAKHLAALQPELPLEYHENQTTF